MSPQVLASPLQLSLLPVCSWELETPGAPPGLNSGSKRFEAEPRWSLPTSEEKLFGSRPVLLCRDLKAVPSIVHAFEEIPISIDATVSEKWPMGASRFNEA